MNILKVIFVLALLNILTTCHTPDPDAVLKQAFNEKEVILLNQIISHYDNYVLSKMGKNKTIKDAYREFLTENGPSAEKKGDLSIFCLVGEERIAFLETLDKDVLANLFHTSDTIYWYANRVFIEAEYKPYYQLNVIYHRYLDFLKILSSRNDFYSSYCENFELCGAITPTTYGDILFAFDKERLKDKKYSETFDFSRKEDRLAFIIPFLDINEMITREGMYPYLYDSFTNILSPTSGKRIHRKQNRMFLLLSCFQPITPCHKKTL